MRKTLFFPVSPVFTQAVVKDGFLPVTAGKDFI
jgi:hypothetical protein